MFRMAEGGIHCLGDLIGHIEAAPYDLAGDLWPADRGALAPQTLNFACQLAHDEEALWVEPPDDADEPRPAFWLRIPFTSPNPAASGAELELPGVGRLTGSVAYTGAGADILLMMGEHVLGAHLQVTAPGHVALTGLFRGPHGSFAFALEGRVASQERRSAKVVALPGRGQPS